MPDIIGEASSFATSQAPLDSHITELRPLTYAEISKRVLVDKHGIDAGDPRLSEIAGAISAHVAQAIEFHMGSRAAGHTIRPVLQYYSFLNFATAVVAAWNPSGFQETKRHGAGDRTYELHEVTLDSTLLSVRKGAIPTFHALFSDLYSDNYFGRQRQLE